METSTQAEFPQEETLDSWPSGCPFDLGGRGWGGGNTPSESFQSVLNVFFWNCPQTRAG